MTATPPSPAGREPEPVEEVWAYGGVRADSKGTRQHAWLLDAGRGKVVYFGKFHADAVGELYRVSVVRDASGPASVYGKPRYSADGRLDTETVAQLRAEHQAALTALSLARRHRAAARRNELDDLAQPLRVIAARMTRPDRVALAAWLITDLTHPTPGRNQAGGDRR
jgi:hypothetical protein